MNKVLRDRTLKVTQLVWSHEVIDCWVVASSRTRVEEPSLRRLLVMAVGWRPPFLNTGPSTGLLMVWPVKTGEKEHRGRDNTILLPVT